MTATAAMTIDAMDLRRVVASLSDDQLPAIVYFEAVVSRLARHFIAQTESVEPRHVLYAAKAAAFPRLFRVLLDAGVHGFDASSPEEAVHIRQHVPVGVPVYVTATALGRRELDVIRLLSPACVHVDSLASLELAICGVPELPLGIRVNPGVSESRHVMTAAGRADCRLGLPIADLPQAMSLAAGAGISQIGLHFHVACEAASFDVHARAVDAVSEALARSGSRTPLIAHLDVGGGVAPASWDFASHEIGASSTWDISLLARAVAELKRNHAPRLSPEFRVIFEPGDALVGAAAVMVAAVVESRRTATGQKHWILNSNVNHFPNLLLDRDVPPVLWPPEQPGGESVVLSGNSCLAGDEIVRLSVGCDATRVVFGSRGAYEYSRMTFFNGRLRPTVVFVRPGGELTEERRDSVADLDLFWGCVAAPAPHTWFAVSDIGMSADSPGDSSMVLPPSIARRMIERFSHPGDVVFDPFAGFGTTIRIARQTGRIGVGIEVHRGRHASASADVKAPHQVVLGDAGNVSLRSLPIADMLFTAPPHWVPESDALKGYRGYADPYALYLDRLVEIIRHTSEAVRPEGAIVIVAMNMRHKGLPVIPFAFDLASRLGQLFRFVGDEVACLLLPEDDAMSFGNHHYCLIYRNEKPV